MHVAVIGGGSAGCMAAAHLSKVFPTVDLYHIYDPHRAPLGVGEGTTPPFVPWIHDTTALPFSALQEQCQMTIKHGIVFENWGRRHRRFVHFFSPATEGQAYHISAADLLPVLKGCIKATTIHRAVTALESDGRHAYIHLDDGTALTVDLAFDARGFPATLGPAHEALACIPTNAALVRRGPPNLFRTATRAVARPHGWIFVIPLTTSTSYGYVFHYGVNTPAEVAADFDAFLEGEQVEATGSGKVLRFPNFVRTSFFDGAVFHIGNAASFVEPLEATALGVTLVQIRYATAWLLDDLLGLSDPSHGQAAALRSLNTFLRDYIRKLALFISWHYARGSQFDTPFWRHARAVFKAAIADPASRDVVAAFEPFLQSGGRLPDALAFAQHPDDLDAIPTPPDTLKTAFGLFFDESFAKVGHGIGYYSTP